MYAVKNERPPFVPYDIVRIKGTQNLAIVREVHLNLCQESDNAQWSFAIYNLSEEKKCAWWDMSELELVDNVFDIISVSSVHAFSNGNFDHKFTNKIRRGLE